MCANEITGAGVGEALRQVVQDECRFWQRTLWWAGAGPVSALWSAERFSWKRAGWGAVNGPGDRGLGEGGFVGEGPAWENFRSDVTVCF